MFLLARALLPENYADHQLSMSMQMSGGSFVPIVFWYGSLTSGRHAFVASGAFEFVVDVQEAGLSDCCRIVLCSISQSLGHDEGRVLQQAVQDRRPFFTPRLFGSCVCQEQPPAKQPQLIEKVDALRCSSLILGCL